jgi:hypothetical protein
MLQDLQQMTLEKRIGNVWLQTRKLPTEKGFDRGNLSDPAIAA